MKRYINYIGLAVLSMVLLSCTKTDTFSYPDGYVGRSKITIYPTITLNGAAIVTVAKGGTYTDPGATAKAGSASATVVATGVPSTATAGVFTETYTATNADGFTAAGTRTIVVYSTDVTAASNDFSGTYLRAATGASATWTKLAPGVYLVDNPGGAVGVNLQVILFNATGNTIKIPSQIAGGNTTSSSTETPNPNLAVPGTLLGYSMIILNPGYGTGLRTFVKQ